MASSTPHDSHPSADQRVDSDFDTDFDAALDAELAGELDDDYELVEDRDADGVQGLGAQFGAVDEHGDCPACTYSQGRSWWGDIRPARSHCSDCHRYWASGREAHCTVCHRHFAYARAFDGHFRDGTCHDPEQILRRDNQPRFSWKDGRFGLTYKLAFYGAQPAHWTKNTEPGS